MLGPKGKRHNFYRSILQRATANTVVLFETVKEAKQFAGASLPVYSSNAKTHARGSIWRAFLRSSAIVVAATRQGVLLPHIKTIIIDEPDRFGFKEDQTPKYDTLAVARWRNRFQKVNLVVGMPALNLETSLMVKKGGRLLGTGADSPIRVVVPRLQQIDDGDLVVVATKNELGDYHGPAVVHSGDIEYLEGAWPRAWFVGFDELAAIPEYNQQEKMYMKLQRLRWLAREVMVPTNHADHSIFRAHFLDLELRERKEGQFPPFCRILKITLPDGATQIHKLPLVARLDKVIGDFRLPKGSRIEVDPVNLT